MTVTLATDTRIFSVASDNHVEEPCTHCPSSDTCPAHPGLLDACRAVERAKESVVQARMRGAEAAMIINHR